MLRKGTGHAFQGAFSKDVIYEQSSQDPTTPLYTDPEKVNLFFFIVAVFVFHAELRKVLTLPQSEAK